MNKILFTTLSLIAVLVMSQESAASDRFHLIVTNNTTQPVVLENIVAACFTISANGKHNDGTCGDIDFPSSFTVYEGEQSQEVGSFVVEWQSSPDCDNQGSITYTVNGENQTMIVDDPYIGSCGVNPCNAGQSCSMHDTGGGEYNLNVIYGGSTPTSDMSLPVRTFNQLSQGQACTFTEVEVDNPAGPISVSGSGVSWSPESQCPPGAPECLITLSVPYGAQGTAIVTDTIVDAYITVSCLEVPMSLPVTTFSQNSSQGNACAFNNVSVLNPHNAISVSGSGASASGSTCSGSTPSCTFNLQVPSGAQGTATVTDGTNDIPIKVSCTPPPPMSVVNMNISGDLVSTCELQTCSSKNPSCCACYFNVDLKNTAATAIVTNITGDNVDLYLVSSTCNGPQDACTITYGIHSSNGGPMTVDVSDGITTITGITWNSCTFP